MDINSFVIGLAKGKKSGFYSTEENDAGGLTYAFRAKESEGGGADAIDSLIDKSITEIKSEVSSIGLYTFISCSSLVNANFPNASSIGAYAFSGCSALTSVICPNVSSIGSYAFRNCSKLSSIDFTNTLTIDISAFENCNVLETANFPNATTISSTAFQSCRGLKSVILPKATSVGSFAFSTCYMIESVDLHSKIALGSKAFNGCYYLKAVILRYNSVIALSNTNVFTECYHILGTVNSSYNPNGDKDGYFYVPRALVGSYQEATNWSAFASQFRALEEYTLDGTITGELDPSKI